MNTWVVCDLIASAIKCWLTDFYLMCMIYFPPRNVLLSLFTFSFFPFDKVSSHKAWKPHQNKQTKFTYILRNTFGHTWRNSVAFRSIDVSGGHYVCEIRQGKNSKLHSVLVTNVCNVKLISWELGGAFCLQSG